MPHYPSLCSHKAPLNRRLSPLNRYAGSHPLSASLLRPAEVSQPTQQKAALGGEKARASFWKSGGLELDKRLGFSCPSVQEFEHPRGFPVKGSVDHRTF